MEECIEAANEITSQPVLIFFVNKLLINQAFLKLDNKMVDLSSCNFVFCLDLLFKFFWVFCIDYADQALNIFCFLEVIYGLNKTRKSSIDEYVDIFTN